MGGGGGHEEPFFVMSCLRTVGLNIAKWYQFSLFNTHGTN